MKRIILLSPFPPAQNPRLFKEYLILKKNGYLVKVLYAERDEWASNYNYDNNDDFILIGGRYGSAFYYLTRFIHKLLKNISPNYLGYNRVSWLLFLRGLTTKADLFIAHNLAALPIAIKIAEFHKVKCGFDAEDFHRQEVTDIKESNTYKKAKYLEDKYFPKLNYLTAASPLIADEYRKIYPFALPIVINNVFSSRFISREPFIKNQMLRLFWFSQTIGKNRGIEDAIAAIGILKNNSIGLSLLGMINPIEKNYFQTLAQKSGLLPNQLIFLEPVKPDDIFRIASKFDIGLALEIDIPFNRDICLTNKLFTYLIAGLAIVASETTAQQNFLKTYSGIGKSFPIGNVNAFSKIIHYYYHNRDALFQTKISAMELAQTEMNWEKESEKFIAIIKSI